MPHSLVNVLFCNREGCMQCALKPDETMPCSLQFQDSMGTTNAVYKVDWRELVPVSHSVGSCGYDG